MKFNQFVRELCTRGFSGEVSLPGHQRYHDSLKFYNRALLSRPPVVLAPRNTADVVNVIRLVRKQGVGVTIKGGGHSVAGENIRDNAILLDMRLLKRIDLKPGARRIILQAGVLNGEVDNACKPYNLALPLGTCPSVGVIGSTLGGGLGFLSRKYGLLCDCVTEFSLVTGKGELLTANARKNTALYRALKGGGAGQFGVVVSAEYALFAIPDKVYGGTISWPLHEGEAILQHYGRLMELSVDALFLYSYTGRSANGEPLVSLFGADLDDPVRSAGIFEQFKHIAPPVKDDLCERSYFALQSGHYEDGLSVRWRNRFLKQPLSDDLVSIIIEGMAECPGTMGGIMLDPVGGAVNRSDANNNVFNHRDCRYILSITGIASQRQIPETTQQWVDTLFERCLPFLSNQSYQNYHSGDDTSPDAYWGAHLTLLRSLKQQLDPDNVLVSGVPLAN